MKVTIFGAGVQGTVYGVRLARVGHEVTLIATPRRAAELRRFGARIRNLKGTETANASLRVREELEPDSKADFCLVTVRREHLNDALVSLARATQIKRFLFLVNHANGSAEIFAAVGRSRVVLGFPGIAGKYEGNVVGYLDIPQQHTAVEEGAADVVELLRRGGFVVDRVRNMDAWLQRHAVFITAIAGAIYENGNGAEEGFSAARLGADREAVGRFVEAVREGWWQLDRRRVTSAPWAMRFIFCWVPSWISTQYWSKLLLSERGEIFFAAHLRRVPAEMLALAADVRSFTSASESPALTRLLDAIERRNAEN